ncbi:FIST signal transduction protein [uncultured Photobacterium sp.]|uniref:FIST signal transduction protein n=1 Tax=uncultured Photobacterium sp. TaxID=173973 RepID=UPI0026130F83|nr:FIST N-terminal domain-containing protein [uncultured Photobacterium sp.]
MDIATSFSAFHSSDHAVSDAIRKLKSKITNPRLILVYFSENYDDALIQQALTTAFPDAQILGCSSCQGVMTDEGYNRGEGIALWAMCDYNGAFGSAIVSTKQSPYDMARQALLRAIENSGRPGELPALILLHASPGKEEDVIKGIEDELGSPVPIVGGSAADDHVKGNWRIFTHEQRCQEGVGLCVLYPSCNISYSFHSGYASTGLSTVVTRTDGRELVELNNKPAIEVYQSWLGQELSDENSIVSKSSLNPLGRVAGRIHDLPYFKLAHLLKVTPRGGIELFATVEEGEELFFMEGTKERLITRAGRVINSAFDIGSVNSSLDPIGGITIYCAGCMLQVQNRMEEVAEHVNKAMHHAPFVCPFTFGEQGQFIGGENAHGNLMISAVLFHRD